MCSTEIVEKLSLLVAIIKYQNTRLCEAVVRINVKDISTGKNVWKSKCSVFYFILLLLFLPGIV